MRKKLVEKNISLQIFLILIMILGVCGISYFIYENTLKDKNQEQDNSNDDEKKYTLDIYKNVSNDYNYICGKKTSSCNEFAFSIEIETQNATFLGVDYEKYLFVLYRDNGLKLYNVETKEITNINLEDSYQNYEVYLSNDAKRIAGIIYQFKDGLYGYYNVFYNTKLFNDAKYTRFYYLDENYLIGETLNQTFSNYSLLNTSSGKEEFSNTNNWFNIESYNGKYFFFEYDSPVEGNVLRIYNNNKQVIYEKTNENCKYSVVNGILYLADNNEVKKYDTSGNLISTSEKLENIQSMVINYALYIKNNYIFLYNVNTKENIKIDYLSDNNTYLSAIYYDKDILSSMGYENREEGIYISYLYKEEDSDGNNSVEYCYNIKTKKVSSSVTRVE